MQKEKLTHTRIVLVLALIFFLFYDLNSYCQSKITGRVVVEETNEPMTKMSLWVDGDQTNCTVDTTGYFEWMLYGIGGRNLIFKSSGFVNKPIDIMLFEKCNVDLGVVKLNFDFENLSFDDLKQLKVVTAGKQEQKLRDIPASVVVINATEIKRMGYKTLEELLENVAGMYSIGNAYWEGGVNFGIRGMASPGVLSTIMFLLNGVNMMQDFNNGFSTDRLIVPIELVEKVEIIRGPMSVLYGSSAFLGAINIITSDPLKKSKQSITTGIGTLGLQKLNLKLSDKVEELKYTLIAGLSKHNGIDESYSKMQSNPQIIESWGLTKDATTHNQFKDDRRFLDLLIENKEFKIDINIIDHTQGVPGSKPSANTITGFSANTIAANLHLSYQRILTDRWSLKSSLNYSIFNQNGESHWNTQNSYGVFSIATKAYEAELNAVYKIDNQFNLISGIYLRSIIEAKQSIDYPELGLKYSNFSYYLKPTENLNTIAAFSQFEWAISPHFNLTTGLRVERTNNVDILGTNSYIDSTKHFTTDFKYGQINQDEIRYIPRLAIVCKLNDVHVLKLMYGQSVIRSSIMENVNLNARKINQLDFAKMQTIEFNYNTNFNTNFSSNFSLYFNQLDNLVVRSFRFNEDGSTNFGINNSGKITTLGVELNLNYNINQTLHLESSISIQNSKDNTFGFENIQTAYSPKLLAYFKGHYQLTNQISIGTFLNYLGEMEAGWDGEKKRRMGKTVNAYILWGANISIENIWKEFYLIIKASNLLDMEIHYPTNQNSQWTDLGMLGFGRRFELNLGYQF